MFVPSRIGERLERELDAGAGRIGRSIERAVDMKANRRRRQRGEGLVIAHIAPIGARTCAIGAIKKIGGIDGTRRRADPALRQKVLENLDMVEKRKARRSRADFSSFSGGERPQRRPPPAPRLSFRPLRA
jgi:hypothetical protein